MKIETMPRSKLLSEIEAAGRVTSEFCEQFITCGRGHETMQTIRFKRDALSVAYVAAMDHECALNFEYERRKRYHGKLTPIKVQA